MFFLLLFFTKRLMSFDTVIMQHSLSNASFRLKVSLAQALSQISLAAIINYILNILDFSLCDIQSVLLDIVFSNSFSIIKVFASQFIYFISIYV